MKKVLPIDGGVWLFSGFLRPVGRQKAGVLGASDSHGGGFNVESTALYLARAFRHLCARPMGSLSVPWAVGRRLLEASPMGCASSSILMQG
ncbi:hypothetical protein SAMN05444581_105125 [Methylocapsa palsarum]|uniref:Uncharacterized protein n=1 Tax=Methylocapsa palsarum TaxID=1612308 RepID=A0A1I3YAF8_9HYPH|nr:hypothetical protein SAMN05444581_105125 [Methylocapsa palsarum]